jgi:hypothetical protein
VHVPSLEDALLGLLDERPAADQADEPADTTELDLVGGRR